MNFSRLQRPAKQAVKNDEKSWFSFLETRLQNATEHHDFREAWSVCRVLAGQGPSKVCDKTVPAARAICRRQWLEHFASVWGAWLHDPAVVEPQCWGGLPLTPVLVGDGRVALLKAAKAQARYRATPQGALPAELWQLVMQKRCVGPRSFNLVPDLCMKAFEQFQLRGYNPQCWCDGQGCPLPKPGGASGPDGQRIINLLDPGGKMFYKALLEFVPDVPAPYQYGYAPRRSRREAILQVEAWLDRLRANKFSTATTLFDLTKAFDTLALQSIEEEVTNSNMPDSVRALLLDLHRRLRIGLTLVDGDKLMLKLESGVLQGGGTGPRLFRMAYDSCIACWQHETHEFAQPVEYLGCLHSVGVAAYADDLVRIVSGRSLEHLDSGTIACTESLATLLHRRGLKLNAKKGETLLSLEGAGAYDAARRAFSGTWKGYPPKQVVKYLGAHIQSNGSLQSEVRKRTASARLGFAKFARFFKRSTVPFSRKVLVFKAVVNGALLSGLEVRTLSPSDCQSLEKARGLLLRRLFGKHGFGAVAGENTHRSVSVASLRERAALPTVVSELRARRLLWFRSALEAEDHGQIRLELAALFGRSEALKPAIDLDAGRPTPFASRFLHVLFQDLQLVIPSFSGFVGAWRADVLRLASRTAIVALRTWQDPVPFLPPEIFNDDGEVPEVLAAPLLCALCGAGPFLNDRALRTHNVRKHHLRNPIQSKNCPNCLRQFTSKSAAQRHVHKGSCGWPVRNHGHAGAIAGQRLAATAAATQAQTRPPLRPLVQTQLSAFFHPQNAGRGLSSSSHEPLRAPSEAQRRRDQQILGTAGSTCRSSVK